HGGGALLDDETEEQRREHHRRDDEEATEIREVLAEIGGAARRGEPVGANIADRQAHRDRVDSRPEARRKAIACRAGRFAALSDDADRRTVAEARAPQSLPR